MLRNLAKVSTQIIVVMIFLVKDGLIFMNELYFATIKFYTSLYQYQEAEGANGLARDSSWVVMKNLKK